MTDRDHLPAEESAAKANGGDWAFPLEADDARGWAPVPGLTKREYFAGLALTGLCNESHGEAYTPEGAAGRAVAMADALLLRLAR